MLKKYYWQNLTNKLKFLILSIFVFSCSFSNSDFWTDAKNIETGPVKETLLFSDREKLNSELNSSLKISLNSSGKDYIYKKNH